MTVRVLVGDALTVLRTLPSESVQCVVSSPPYFALRSYLPDGHPDKEREIGGEPTPWAFLESLWAVMDEVKRVLRSDGLAFINIGDSYSGSGKGPTGQNGIGDQERRQGFTGVSTKSTLKGYTAGSQLKQAILGGGVGVEGLPAKNLLLIPQRFAIGMQDRGWWVRSEIVWAKTSAMPESVRDRPTSAWEPIWMFSKSARYWYDAEAVRETLKQPDVKVPHGFGGHKRNGGTTYSGNPYDASHLVGANLRNVWTLGPSPLKEAHYAAFPPEIPRRCILAATSEKGACSACGAGWRRVVEQREREGVWRASPGQNLRQDNRGALLGVMPGQVNGQYDPHGDSLARWTSVTTGWQPGCSCDAGDPVPQVVLDPFAGSGTTLLVADRLGRDAIGIELNETYARMAEARIQRDAGPMFGDAVTVETPRQPALFGAEAARGG